MRAYIDGLRAGGELRVVSREVGPRFELAAVVAPSQQESSLSILFEKMRGSKLPGAPRWSIKIT